MPPCIADDEQRSPARKATGPTWEIKVEAPLVCVVGSRARTGRDRRVGMEKRRARSNGGDGNRTHDLYNAIVALSQLSYAPSRDSGRIIPVRWSARKENSSLSRPRGRAYNRGFGLTPGGCDGPAKDPSGG